MITDAPHERPDFTDEDIDKVPVILIENLKSTGLDFSNQYYISKKYSDKLRNTKLRKDDLVIARIGVTTGVTSIIDEKSEGFNICGNISLIRLKDGINAKFINAYLNTGFFQQIIKRELSTSARDFLTIGKIKDFEIIKLDIPIQEKVVTLLDLAIISKKHKEEKSLEIIKKIDENLAKIIGFEFPENQEKKTFATKRTSFENRLDPHFYLPNFKSLIDNIRKTDNAQLVDLVEFSKETWNQKDGFEKEFPYIEISEIDLASGKINNISILPIEEAPSRAKMIVRENDIIVSTTRPHRGAISLITNNMDGFIASTGFAVLRNLKTDTISKEYLYYILRTQICLQQMLQRSSGGSYPAITAEELKNIYIPIPSKEIQNEVVEEIKRYIEEAERLKNEATLEFEAAKKEIENLILN